ncbi:MAG: BPSS1780 family membrane protein [Casimicrobiaceae bacterium]
MADRRQIARDIAFTRQPGANGTRWLARSYAMFAKARMNWIVLLLTYYAVLLLAEFVPFIGVLAAPVLKPVFAVGFLAAAWTQERGEMPGFQLLFRGFRSNLSALVLLGIVYAVGITIAISASQFVDGGKLLALISDRMPAELDQEAAALRLSETLADPQVQLGMIVGALCAIPTLFALWWAPALVVFQDASATTALSTSLRAALANWRPILRYALAAFFFGGLLPTVVGTLLALFIPAPVGRALALALMLPYVFFFVATLHISDYVSYRDVFHASEPPATPAAGAPPP